MADRRENTSEGARLPSWYDGKKIDEVLFCSDFLGRHPMVSLGRSWAEVPALKTADCAAVS